MEASVLIFTNENNIVANGFGGGNLFSLMLWFLDIFAPINLCVCWEKCTSGRRMFRLLSGRDRSCG